MKVWLVVALLSSASPASAADRWPGSAGTAFVLPPGQGEVGLFQPLRLGLGREVELSTHAALDLVMPNLALLKSWGRVGPVQLASRHSLSYPAGLLKLLAREGTGGILPYETYVPHILMFGNEARASLALGERYLLTARVGATVAAIAGRSSLETIDLPLVWPRLAPVFDHATFVLGADLDGALWGPLDFFVDVDCYLVPDDRGPLAVEQAGALIWHVSNGFAALVGYKLVFGTYPAPSGFRTQWHLLPLADLVWSF